MALRMPKALSMETRVLHMGRAVSADRHGGDSRRFVRGGVDQQQALGAAVAKGFNMPLEKFRGPEVGGY